MSRFEKYPDQAESSLNKSNEALERADDALDDAVFRQEAIAVEMETADASVRAGLLERHRALDLEIEGLRHDFNAAEQHHIQNQNFWLEDDDDGE